MTNENKERTAEEIRREYFRNWRAKNKDKVKKYNADYWKRKLEKEQENV